MIDLRGEATRLLERAEARRVRASTVLDDRGGRAEHGQFFTPAKAAILIASLPTITRRAVRVLDPGAGTGMLSAALVARLLVEAPDVELEIVAVEQDITVMPWLEETLADCAKSAANGGVAVSTTALVGDYIQLSTGLDQRIDLTTGFDLVIQNPPYKKLAAASPHRRALQQEGLETPNVYAAFLALGVRALRAGGQSVAITPRSFCNGPYFAPFRTYLLDALSLDHVHLFESRSTIFADTAVLQENVVLSATARGPRDSVVLSESTGHRDDVTSRVVPYKDVVRPDDPNRFIRLATRDGDMEAVERVTALPSSLHELGVTASTGRVVDFRSRNFLAPEPRHGAVPLIYPGNLRDGHIEWPRGINKAQWFLPETDRERAMLVPEGWYCVIKRFSAKEERRRIVAAVWSPLDRPGAVAFENHLNFLHADGSGLRWIWLAGCASG